MLTSWSQNESSMPYRWRTARTSPGLSHPCRAASSASSMPTPIEIARRSILTASAWQRLVSPHDAYCVDRFRERPGFPRDLLVARLQALPGAGAPDVNLRDGVAARRRCRRRGRGRALGRPAGARAAPPGRQSRARIEGALRVLVAPRGQIVVVDHLGLGPLPLVLLATLVLALRHLAQRFGMSN